jgi:hypothetical protein
LVFKVHPHVQLQLYGHSLVDVHPFFQRRHPVLRHGLSAQLAASSSTRRAPRHRAAQRQPPKRQRQPRYGSAKKHDMNCAFGTGCQEPRHLAHSRDKPSARRIWAFLGQVIVGVHGHRGRLWRDLRPRRLSCLEVAAGLNVLRTRGRCAGSSAE